jgi:glyoxylase-like metal-dependent hydrolase (beta-lactamase superfamily II)
VMRRLSESLFRFDDTCAVYLVRTGEDGVLVDVGSGAVFDRLAEAGVERVTDVLLTHHHRDNAAGAARAARLAARIHVPHAELDLVQDVSSHWQARAIRNSYDNREDRFSLLEDVPVHAPLRDYATLRFGALELRVIPTPGHTAGSVTLLGVVDGVRVAFTGDLIYAPGKVVSLAATQWSYNGAEGVAASVASLLDLKDRTPERLLPAHGEPMDDPSAAIDGLVARLWALLRERDQNPRLFTLRDEPFEALTRHLLRNRTAMAYHYVLLSDDGTALFFDYGYDFVTGIAAGSDRASRRPWLYTLASLARDHGVTAIEAVVPTHYHDDHVAGTNLLRDATGAQVWAAESFADVLERPHHYDLPCLWYDPIPVDRVLPLETPIAWREHAFTLHALPGHTRYAVAISLEVDGVRTLIAGDQYAGGGAALPNYVYRNRFDAADYRSSAALYRRLAPRLVLSGHWDPEWIDDQAYFDRLDARGRALEALHRDLLPDDEHGFGADGFAASIRPYDATTTIGETLPLEVEIRNPFPRAAAAAARLVLPEGWRAEPALATATLPPSGETTVRFTLRPVGAPCRRARIAVSLEIDGRAYGQRAEALVTVTVPRSTASVSADAPARSERGGGAA